MNPQDNTNDVPADTTVVPPVENPGADAPVVETPGMETPEVGGDEAPAVEEAPIAEHVA